MNRLTFIAGLGASMLALGAWVYHSVGDGNASGTPVVLVSLANANTPDAVTRALARGKPTVIEFGANACASCRQMKPILAALERDHGANITVADIDIIKDRTYISRYQIKLMPTQIFFDANGRELGRHMGVISDTDILNRLGQKQGQP